MKRRDAVKGVFLFSLGTGFLFSCSDPFEAVKSLNLTNLTFEDHQLQLIHKISIKILPINEIEALKDHTSLPFVMKSVNDLYSNIDREIFEDVYKNWANYFFDVTTKKWNESNDEDTSKLLNEINKIDSKSNTEIRSSQDKLKFFIDILKNENILYLRTSEFVQTTYKYYEMTPGRFNGNFLLSDLPMPINPFQHE